MAVADFIKSFSLSESSLRSSSTGTTTQVVGVLSVLAISGSVAFLTLGNKFKITTTRDDASDALKIEGTGASTAGGDASEPLSMNGGSGMGRKKGTATEAFKINGRDGMNRTSGPSKMESGKAGRKRVRFADDVVDPRGNGQEYRMRFAQRQHEEGLGGRKLQPRNPIPANRTALYKGLRQYRLQQHYASLY